MSSLDKARETLVGLSSKLPGTRCQARFLDLLLLDGDLADPRSLVSTKLTAEEAAAVRNERASLLRSCTLLASPAEESTPYLYKVSRSLNSAVALSELKQKYAAESAAGPFEGVKSSSHH